MTTERSLNLFSEMRASVFVVELERDSDKTFSLKTYLYSKEITQFKHARTDQNIRRDPSIGLISLSELLNFLLYFLMIRKDQTIIMPILFHPLDPSEIDASTFSYSCNCITGLMFS